MDQQEIISRVNAFLVDDFEVDEKTLKPEADIRTTLDLDSLDYIDLAVAIEHSFKFKVKPEDFQPMQRMQDLYDYVSNRLQTTNA